VSKAERPVKPAGRSWNVVARPITEELDGPRRKKKFRWTLPQEFRTRTPKKIQKSLDDVDWEKMRRKILKLS